MRKFAVAGALILLPVSTQAQDTTTTCQQVGNTVQCVSRTRPNPYSAIQNYPDPGAAFTDAFNAAQQQPSVPPVKSTNYPDMIRARVREYLQARDCATAKALALRSGETELVEEVKESCGTP